MNPLRLLEIWLKVEQNVTFKSLWMRDSDSFRTLSFLKLKFGDYHKKIWTKSDRLQLLTSQHVKNEKYFNMIVSLEILWHIYKENTF